MISKETSFVNIIISAFSRPLKKDVTRWLPQQRFDLEPNNLQKMLYTSEARKLFDYISLFYAVGMIEMCDGEMWSFKYCTGCYLNVRACWKQRVKWKINCLLSARENFRFIYFVIICWCSWNFDSRKCFFLKIACSVVHNRISCRNRVLSECVKFHGSTWHIVTTFCETIEQLGRGAEEKQMIMGSV